MQQTNNWHTQQIITRCLTGDWHIISGANYEIFGELDMHLITFISHRRAIKKDFSSNMLPAQIAYFAPWNNTYFITN
jgi:hypothetical protein